MNEQREVSGMEFRREQDERVIHELLDVCLDHFPNISKQDPDDKNRNETDKKIGEFDFSRLTCYLLDRIF